MTRFKCLESFVCRDIEWRWCQHENGARIAELVKSLNLYSKDCRFDSHCQRSVFWYRPLSSLSLQIASVASGHHGKNNGGPNQWIIRVKLTPELLKIHLSLLVKSSQISLGDV